MRHSSARRFLAVTGGLSLAAAMVLPATADTNDAYDPELVAEKLAAFSGDPSDDLVANLGEGRIAAFIELNTPTTVQAAKERSGASIATVQKQVDSLATSVAQQIDDPNATVMYTTENAIAGFAVEADAQALAKLTERDEVKSVRPLTINTVENSASVNLTRAIDAWKAAGKTGKDVTVAIIDSGVDFTHADFGGNGDYGAYSDAAKRAETPTWPQGKVIGGWDFVGEGYYGAGAGSVVAPDGNPIDVPDSACNAPKDISRSGGHGSHVAGTAAGFGVTADGKTFQGDYSKLTADEVNAMKIGPGSAPEANILAFKVFGCAGSTGYVAKALDELLAKNPDGSWKWKDVDVVNMSLGSSYSSPTDPQSLIIKALFEERGIVSAVSSGNSGDLYDVGGAPGASAAALTVANSVHGTSTLDQASFNYDGADHLLAGQLSVDYAWPQPQAGPFDLVQLTGANAEACSALSAEDAAKVKGKAALIEWREPLACGSKARFDNIAKAGGTGVVIKGAADSFSGGIAGNESIPGIQLTKTNTDAVLAALAKGAVQVTFDSAQRGTAKSTDPNAVDTLAASSSRGVHGSFGVVKPDIAAPGTQIVSAGVGTGNGPDTMTGTSMASPHVAGVAALMKQAKPKWSAAQIKAGIMNTAFHDIHTGKLAYGPQRVGSGRVDGFAAVNNDVLMYSSDNPELVSVNFGVVEFPQSGFSAEQKVTLENLGSAAAHLDLRFADATAVPGVKFSVSPAKVNVPAGGKQEVTVSVSVDAEEYRKVIDPTMTLQQSFRGNQVRQFISTATGRLIATGSGAPEGGELRLPVSMAPKPVSDLKSTVSLSADGTSGVIKTAGEKFLYPGDREKKILPYRPLAMPFEWVASSPERELTNDEDKAAVNMIRATDIKNVGIRKMKDTIVVGVETWGPAPIHPVPTSVIGMVIQAKGEKFDIVPQRVRDTDIAVVHVAKNGKSIATTRYNDALDGGLDTNTMDSTVVALPVPLRALGFTDAELKSGEVELDITVIGSSRYAPFPAPAGYAEGDTDRVNFKYTPGKAAFDFTTSLPFSALEKDGDDIPFTVKDAAAAPTATGDVDISADPKKPAIMMMHFHNSAGIAEGAGAQAEVLPLSPEPSPTPTETSTVAPTDEPSPTPTEEPSPTPTDTPTPSEEPTVAPTDAPTVAPTDAPTVAPTTSPTSGPTVAPSPSGPGKPPLPITGSDAALPGLLALGLIGAGGVLVLRRRAAQQ